MKEKIQKLNPQKTFLAGMLILLVVYGLLWFVQMMNVGVISKGEMPQNISIWKSISLVKYSVPFPFGMCSVLEWVLPLFLCLSYVALAVGQKKVHITLSCIAIAGFIQTCVGSLGLELYGVGGSLEWHPLFFADDPYWRGADSQIGVYLPIYFALWYLVALVLMVCAPKIVKWMGKSNKAKKVGLILLFLVALSEGILFNVVYFGQYTVFFVLRSILIFIPILFVLLKADVQDETVEESVCEEKTGKFGELSKVMKIFGIGMSVCVFICLLSGVLEVVEIVGSMSSWGKRADISEMIRYFVVTELKFFNSNFSLFLAAAFSVYIVKGKKSKTTLGIMATLCGIAFFAQYFLLLQRAVGFIVFGNQVAMVAWCIILYLLLTWLWKESRTIKMVFLGSLYLIIISTTWIVRFYLQETVSVFSYIYLILDLVMFGITLYALRESKVAEEESVPDKRGLFVWLLLLAYALVSTFEYGMVWTVCTIQGKDMIIQYGMPILGQVAQFMESSGTTVLYVFAFLIVVSYLAHAMKKKEMYLFCSLGAFTTMFFVESKKTYDIGERGLQLGLPVTMVLVMILLFMLPVLCKLFPKREKVLGVLFLMGTYGVLFCHYVLPLTACEFHVRHRPLPYVLAQILLLGITVVAFAMYGKKNEKIEEIG